MLKSSINLKRNEMGKISNYVQDADVKLNDKLLGSDESGTTNNYTITSISKIFKEANAAGVGGQFTYKLDAGAGVGIESGEMDATFSGGDLDFADVTAIKVSIYTYENPTTNLTNALSILNSKKILIVDVNNHNNYGIYSTGTISISSGVCSLSLTYVSGNGAMVDDKVYAITVNYPDGDTTYSEATSSSEGLMSTAHHDKLDGIETSADVTDKTNVKAALALFDSTDTVYIGDADDDATIIVRGTLQVDGTTTTVNSTTVSLDDHNIVLDSGNSTSAVINGAGITIEGGSGDDATFTYSTTGPQFEMKLGSAYEDLKVGKIIASEGDIADIFNTALTLGRDADNKITFAVDDKIIVSVAGAGQFNIISNEIQPTASNSIALGDGTYTFKELYLHGGNITSPSSSQLDFTTTTAAFSSAITAGADVDVTGSVKCTQNLRRTITAVTLSTNTATCTLTANDNFSFTLNNAANTINIVAAAENVGQSGTIIATNPSSVGSFSVNQIQGNGDAAEVLTPDGATISWPTNANGVNLISYYVAAQDKILINFIGNFTNP